MTTATISSKGWIVIPAALRRKYKLHPGDSVDLVDYGNALAIVPVSTNPILKARGMLKGDTSLVDALLAERKQERSREQ